MITVAPAIVADGAALTELRSIGSAELADERGAAGLFRELANVTPQVVFTARIDDVVVAFATATLSPTVSTLHELFVRPEARGIGVGRALVLALQQAARAAGSTSFESVVLPGMRASKNFFEAHGMVAQRIVVGRTLDGS